MIKYSIIVPIFNAEKFLKRCLDSILAQTYTCYEVILVNDGSIDKSQNIIDEYKARFPEIFKCYSFQKNYGQSYARNFGVKNAEGEYIFFIDSDDYIDRNLLEEINKVLEIEKDTDLLRISSQIISNGKCTKVYKAQKFNQLNGRKAFVKIRRNRIVLDIPWAYIISKKFWQDNIFEFPEDKSVEDFGLLPIVIMKANKVSAIDYPYYNHIVREGSEGTSKEYNKVVKKAYDMIYHYQFLIDSIQKMYKEYDIAKKEYIQFITDGVFCYFNMLDPKDRKQYKEKLKEINIISNIKVYSVKSLIKKIIYIYYMRFK